jgi:uncharacterized membrane protein YccF (DUF307 family)
MTTSTIVRTDENPGCLIQLLWFFFFGVWLGQVWMAVAWLLMITVIGLPVGISMVNVLPKIIALRAPVRHWKIYICGPCDTEKQEIKVPQLNFYLRAYYSLFIGLWLCAVSMEAAFWLCASVIGLPIGFWVFDWIPAILSLHRS